MDEEILVKEDISLFDVRNRSEDLLHDTVLNNVLLLRLAL